MDLAHEDRSGTPVRGRYLTEPRAQEARGRTWTRLRRGRGTGPEPDAAQNGLELSREPRLVPAGSVLRERTDRKDQDSTCVTGRTDRTQAPSCAVGRGPPHPGMGEVQDREGGTHGRALPFGGGGRARVRLPRREGADPAAPSLPPGHGGERGAGNRSADLEAGSRARRWLDERYGRGTAHGSEDRFSTGMRPELEMRSSDALEEVAKSARRIGPERRGMGSPNSSLHMRRGRGPAARVASAFRGLPRCR